MNWFRSCIVALALIVCAPFSARADLPAGITLDEGFTYFEATTKSDTVDSKPVGYWYPTCSFRLLGDIPPRSGFKLVVKKDGQELHKMTIDGFMRPGPGETPNIPKQMVVIDWWKPVKLTQDGTFDAELYYIDGKTDEQHLARTFKLDVRKVTTVRGSVTDPEAGPDEFFVNRHPESAVAILYLKREGVTGYTLHSGVGWMEEKNVELVMSYSPSLDASGPKLGRLKIKVDGKVIDSPNQNGVIQDEIGFGEELSTVAATLTDRNAPQFKTGTAHKDMILFKRRSFKLPLIWGDHKGSGPRMNHVNLKDHPGEWELTWIIDREPVRTWKFTVGADGMPVQHAEQKAGLTLAPDAYLLDTVIPGTGGEFDQRLTNEFADVAFHGRAWVSDAAKAMAKAIPSKGKPFPVTSDAK